MDDQEKAVRWLRPHEVATRCEVSRGTINRWRTKFQMTTRRMPSGEYQYREDQIAEIMRRRDANEPIEPFEPDVTGPQP